MATPIGPGNIVTMVGASGDDPAHRIGWEVLRRGVAGHGQASCPAAQLSYDCPVLSRSHQPSALPCTLLSDSSPLFPTSTSPAHHSLRLTTRRKLYSALTHHTP
jgi:hypothetical protein